MEPDNKQVYNIMVGDEYYIKNQLEWGLGRDGLLF